MKFYQRNYKNITNVLIIFLFFIFNFVQLSAQVQVTGTVTSSEDSQKIPGVSIVVKGTSTGSVTDFSGNYSIAVPSSGTTLIFSSVGMETKEITIDGKTVINIILNPDLQLLDEVVIIGYGSVKKSDLTGSVASISAKNLEEQAPAPSFDILLDGQVAGVQIQRTSGTPGGSVNINIRGISSVTGGNQPLYVIDGFPIVPGGNSSDISFTKNSFSSSNFASPTVSRLNPLTSINPNDIKSIEILKDASATAIYGSRGANGVVLITTKKGKKGEGKIEFDMSYGFQEVASKIDLLNGSQFADYIKDGRNNRHLYLTGGSGSIDDLNSVRNGGSRFPDAFRNPESVKTVTDWQDEIFRIAPIQNYQLSFSGGSKNIDYRVSGGYFQQEGIIKTTDFERYNIRTNINSHLRQNLKIGVNMNAFRTEGNFANTSGHYAQGNVIAAALTADPTVPLFNEDGEYTTTYIFPALIDPDNQPDVRGGVFNPLRHLYGSTDFREAFGVLANTYLEWDIIDKLTFRTTFGVNFSQNSTHLWRSGDVQSYGSFKPSIAASQTSNTVETLNENTLTYSNSFGKHNLSVVAGFTNQKSRTSFLSAAASGFGTDNIHYISGGIVNAGTLNINEWSLLSLLGRATYSFDGKYYLTATVRRDGSSRFGSDNRWGTFPSIAFAYKLSEESFLESTRDWLSNLKLRASYGSSGNNQIGNYQSIGLLSSQNYVIGGVEQSGLAPSTLSNPGLTWEASKQANIGIDLGLFNDRVSLTVDVFKDTKTEMLTNVPLALVTGFSSSILNLGKVENKGVEITLNTINIRNENFEWSTQFNISSIKNKVLSLGDDNADVFGIGTGQRVITRVGKPISSFYAKKVVGIFQTQEEVDAYNADSSDNLPDHTKSRPGDLMFEDVDGDGRISNADKTIVGSPWADYTYGLTNNFRYKNFNLSVQITGSQGNDVWAAWGFSAMNSAGVQNQWVGADKRWRSTLNPGDGLFPRAVRIGNQGNWNPPSSRFVFDGSYVRINNLRLAYDLPTQALDVLNLDLNRLSLYFNANNIHTFTDYPGYNPSASSGGNQLTAQGYDQGNYPLSRSFILGVQISF